MSSRPLREATEADAEAIAPADVRVLDIGLYERAGMRQVTRNDNWVRDA
jgi:hypothetical protein